LPVARAARQGGDTTQFNLHEMVISPRARGNAYDSTHSSDLKAVEELFGVCRPPGAGIFLLTLRPGCGTINDALSWG
jgi:hypothetical protein